MREKEEIVNEFRKNVAEFSTDRCPTDILGMALIMSPIAEALIDTRDIMDEIRISLHLLQESALRR